MIIIFLLLENMLATVFFYVKEIDRIHSAVRVYVLSNFSMFVFCKMFYKKIDLRKIFIYNEVRLTINKRIFFFP